MAGAPLRAQYQNPIDYPESDGKPMAETEVHREEMIAAIEALVDHFRNAPDVYVGGNMLFYFEEGNPSACLAPDTFVVKGVAKHRRRIYKVWEEGRAPEVVIEFTSRSTRFEDQGTKRALYAFMGVREYLLFDPLDEYLDPPLQGYRLRNGEYERLELEPDGTLVSEGLGMILSREGTHLRLRDRVTGEMLLTPLEAQERRRDAERRLTEERREAERRLTEERAFAQRLAVRGCELVLKLRWPALNSFGRDLERLHATELEALAEALSSAPDEAAARRALETAGLASS